MIKNVDGDWLMVDGKDAGLAYAATGVVEVREWRMAGMSNSGAKKVATDHLRHLPSTFVRLPVGSERISKAKWPMTNFQTKPARFVRLFSLIFGYIAYFRLAVGAKICGVASAECGISPDYGGNHEPNGSRQSRTTGMLIQRRKENQNRILNYANV